jgi:predicted nucleic acid-binding protein
MSIITMMELILGARNKKEIENIQKAFRKIEILNIDEKISEMAYGSYSNIVKAIICL